MLHSYLYVPADRPDLMAKAVAGDAHAVILDLEDGVAPAARDAACVQATATLASLPDTSCDADAGPIVAVRVHPDHLAEHLLVAVEGSAAMVYLPKADRASVESCDAELTRIEARLGRTQRMPLVALVETAQGLLDAPDLARHARVDGLALGESDLCAELGIDPDLENSARSALRLPLVVASAAAGTRGPTGPASTDYRDLDGFRRSCRELRRLGFVARSAVHPAQVPIINEEFGPDPETLAAARDLVTRFDEARDGGRGVIVGDDGRMIDEAVVRSARRMLE